MRHKKYRKYYLAILFVIVLVLLPTHQAEAGWTKWTFEQIFGNVLWLIFSMVGKVIGVLAVTLNWVIHIRVYPDGGLPVVDESWKIMRDFANMFFIVALIVMAFATIFNITKYEARTLFPKFLISALLINFSLVLGVLVIDASQVLTNTFLVSIGDMGNRLGQDLNPSKFLPSEGSIKNVTAGTAVDATVFGTLVSLVFSVVLLFTFLFSILTALLFAIIRIPILWALLVVSPIAWVLNIFPAGQGTYKKWWSLFIGWNMFLPIFLFFLYFGLYFLSNQDKIMQQIAAAQASANPPDLPFSFQLLFFYVLAAIFLIGGTITAMKASMFSGTGVVSVAKWSRGVAARRLGLTAAGAAAREKIGQIKEEGLPGRFGQKLYGGDYGLAQQTRRFGARFGVRGAEVAGQKAFVDRAGKDYTDFERQYQNGQITEAEVVNRAKQFSATDPRGFAYRKLAAKIGQLDNDMFTSTLTQLSKNPLAAEDFAKTAKEAKFSRMKGEDLRRMAAAESGPGYDYSSLKNSVAARREMFRYVLTDKKAMSGLDDSQIEAGIGVFGGHTTAEGRDFLKEMGKVNPDFAVKYNLAQDASGAFLRPDLVDTTKEGFSTAHKRKPAAGPAGKFELKTHMFGGFLRSGDMKDIAGIKTSTIENNPEFRESLKIYISQFSSDRARRNYVQRLERALLDTPGGDRRWDLLRNGRGTPGALDYIPPTIGNTYYDVVAHPKRPLIPPTGVTPPLG